MVPRMIKVTRDEGNYLEIGSTDFFLWSGLSGESVARVSPVSWSVGQLQWADLIFVCFGFLTSILLSES